MKSFFPDVNVWVALAYRGHQRHPSAVRWLESLDSELAYFCQVTQLSFLRLITHPSIMGDDLKTQAEAWRAYDVFLSDERIAFHPEPDPLQLESAFRKFTSGQRFSSKQWPDAYLAGFAESTGLILVTFDRALHLMLGGNSLLLG